MKQVKLIVFFGFFLLMAACEAGPIRSSYRPVLPELPGHWTALLGEPHWRLEWLNQNGRWQEFHIAPGSGPDSIPALQLIQEWSSPVLAWPYWPSRELLPGMMRPAGGIFPWDISGNRLHLSWSGGVEAVFWKDLAAAERTDPASEGRLPWYFDWPRFRELILNGNIPENVRQDLWLPDWKSIAQRTVQSGFDRRRIVSRAFSTMTIPDPGGPWIGSSPFAPPLEADPSGLLEIGAANPPDTWVSEEGILRVSSSGWVFIRKNATLYP